LRLLLVRLILDSAGEVLVHRNLPATPERFLAVVRPYRDDLVVAVESIFTWYRLTDVCAEERIPFVLGHALYMKAIHGGKAKNDKIDARKIAVLLRGGMIPMAYVCPAAMRATRDLLRRRTHLVRKRGELLAHIQNTNPQYNLPAFEKKIAYKGNREGLAERFADPSVRLSVATDLTLIGHSISSSASSNSTSCATPRPTMSRPTCGSAPSPASARAWPW
jgi:transposase